MHNLINDIKVSFIMILISIMYFGMIREEYNVFYMLDIVDMFIIFSFSLYILSVIITYKYKIKYINDLYKYLSISFLSIGLSSFSYICFLNERKVNECFKNSCISIQIFSYIAECCFMIYCFNNYKKKTNYKNFFLAISSLTIVMIYISSVLSFESLDMFKNIYAECIMMGLYILAIYLKTYLLKLIKISKDDMSKIMNVYLNAHIYLNITSILINIAQICNIGINFTLAQYLLRVYSNYCIIKIVIVETIKNPQYFLYKDLIKKSDEMESTVLELKRTINEKDIIYNNYKRKTKQEEIKNEILTNISHEFKTPVNVIYSAVQTQDLLKKTGSKNEITKYNNVIKQNCNRLIRLINNFIDTTRFDKENVKAEFVCENIVEITEYLTMSVVPFANSKRLSLIFDTSDEELYSMIDKELYDRLILNLLSNAIKYSRKNGHIKVEIKDIDKYVQISVEDDGIGIDKYHLKDIFNRFERVDKSYSRNTEGCGLGLNIVKKIVDMHKGTIDIKSIKEKGTKVFVNIPKCMEKITDQMCHRFEDNTYVKYEVEVEMSDIY